MKFIMLKISQDLKEEKMRQGERERVRRNKANFGDPSVYIMKSESARNKCSDNLLLNHVRPHPQTVTAVCRISNRIHTSSTVPSL